MGETNDPCAVNYHHQRHSSQLQNVDLLPVASGHPVIRVGHARERQPFRAPIGAECICAIRTHRQDLCTASREVVIIISESRQLRAAVWSKKTPQKDKDDRPTSILGEADDTSARVAQLKFGGKLSRLQ